MSIYRREIDAQCCNQWMNGIRTINGQYPDDNREFGILEGTGIIITPETAGIRITCTVPTADTLTAGDNIDISPNGSDELVISLVSNPVINGDIQVNGDIIQQGSTALTGDVGITGDLQVNGDIIQQGSAYETHAEKVFTTNDYITMRDGAVAALAPGDYSGFQVEKYDGTNDGRLVIDRDGVARVGDVGDEQPLLTRDESADLTDGESLVWDAANSKAVTAAIPSAISTALAGKQATLTQTSGTLPYNGTYFSRGNAIYFRYGNVVTIQCSDFTPHSAGLDRIMFTLPPEITPSTNRYGSLTNANGGESAMVLVTNTSNVYLNVANAASFYGVIVYLL